MINDIDRARSALQAIDPSCRRTEWARIGMAAKDAGLALEDFIDWSRGAENFGSERDCRSAWKSFRPGPVKAATLFGLARDAGWHDQSAHRAHQKPQEAPKPRPVAPDPDDERKRATAARIWPLATGLADTPAAAYLLGRGCALPPGDGDLRFHPRLRLFGFDGPAMVGRISDAQDARRGLGLHLTWLRRDGGRWVRAERRYLGRKAGGVVRLWPDEAVTLGLALAEGIESALATARVFAPAWACLDAGNLRDFPVLAGEVALSIFVDRDASGTGQGAAAECAVRWREAEREVRVLGAVRTGADMADIAAEVA